MSNKVLVAVNPFITDTADYPDFQFVVNPWGGDPTSELIEKEMGKDLYLGLIVGTKKVTNSILEKCPTLKVISRVGAGVDNVDIDFFRKNGVTTVYTPYGPTDSTAEQAVALILAGLKKIPQYNEEMKSSVWNRKMGKRLKDCTVGIVGTGRIGKRVVELLKPFGCKIFLHDENADYKLAEKYGLQYVDKHKLIMNSDIITLHAAYNESTKGWLSKQELELVKEGVVIVNVARGGLVDEDALVQHLAANQESIYCADVFNDEPYTGKFTRLSNVILTPHVSTFTYGAKLDTEKQALDNCIKVLRGERCENTL